MEKEKDDRKNNSFSWFRPYMNNTAYNELYLDDMIQKTGYLFKLIARNTKQPFQVITEYMKGDYLSYMDMVSVNRRTPAFLESYVDIMIAELEKLI